MPEIPVNSALGYVGVFLLLFGFFLILAGLDIFKVEKVTVKPGPKTWGFGIILAVFGLGFLLPDIFVLIPKSATPTATTVVVLPTLTNTATLQEVTDTPTSTPMDPIASQEITHTPTSTAIPQEITDTPTPTPIEPPTNTPKPPTATFTPKPPTDTPTPKPSNTPTNTPIPSPIPINTDNPWIDNFDSPVLNSRWFWVREDKSHWSLTDRPGFLRIVTQGGGLFTSVNELRNLLLTTTPPGDFQITTRLTFLPSEDFHYAGIYIYQDDDNFIKLTRGYSGGDNKVRFRQEVAGEASDIDVIESATDIYLRIEKKGDTYQGSYSTDGSKWIDVGEVAPALLSPKIGISAQNGTSLLDINADFEFFSVETR